MKDPTGNWLVRDLLEGFVGFQRGSIKDNGGLGLTLLRSDWVDYEVATWYGDLTRFAFVGGWDGVSLGHCGRGFSAAVRAFGGGYCAATTRAHGSGGQKLLGGGVGVPTAVSMLWILFWVMGCSTSIWVPELLGLRWVLFHGWGCWART
ncbi:hypothetical protein RchiOBHm_Chr6g0307831 [Rosa chinensis]|uniref:Uncharacterized protein n=1 Tax=Rosa chinensis TaxID=74649 RepID=A0A2P6Q0I6_ROSCH|nr:hypothetical protein RchiOBHm_Chr6g0307831 [Rosa chinensis]